MRCKCSSNISYWIQFLMRLSSFLSLIVIGYFRRICILSCFFKHLLKLLPHLQYMYMFNSIGAWTSTHFFTRNQTSALLHGVPNRSTGFDASTIGQQVGSTMMSSTNHCRFDPPYSLKGCMTHYSATAYVTNCQISFITVSNVLFSIAYLPAICGQR